VTKVVHFEIPADDTTRAREFWGGLFGIEFQTYDGPQEYHVFANDDQTGGGLMPRVPGQNGLVVYFGTDNIDASAKRVEELGGTVTMGKQPVPGMGWILQVEDPEGNDFAFWQPDENAPAPEQ
jgi:predicted enzyme related to lactoylglutathione lyase